MPASLVLGKKYGTLPSEETESATGAGVLVPKRGGSINMAILVATPYFIGHMGWPRGTHLRLVLRDTSLNQYFGVDQKKVKEEAVKNLRWFSRNLPDDLVKRVLGQAETFSVCHLVSVKPSASAKSFRHFVVAEVSDSTMFSHSFGRHQNPLDLFSEEHLKLVFGKAEGPIWFDQLNRYHKEQHQKAA